MNYISYGRQRDEKVIQLIEDARAITRLQIQEIFFASRKSGQRICQRCLARITQRGYVKKWERSPQEPTIYYTRKPKYLNHTLLVSQIYVELIKQKPSHLSVKIKWYYSILNNMVICDLLLIITNLATKKREAVFIEAERSPSKRFDKPEKYEKVRNTNCVNEEWVVIEENKAIFPTVLIVTEEELTVKHEKIRFVVANMQQVKKDVYGLIRRSVAG